MTVSLDVNDRTDLELLLLLANRLGIRILNKHELIEKKDVQLKNDLKTIQAGINLSESRLNNMLDKLEESRDDRQLPFREL